MLIFFHIPKTAGLTFLQILSAHYPENAILDIHDEKSFKNNADINPDKLAEYQVLSGHFPFSFIEKCPKNSTSITFLRDPSKRVLSLFNFYKNNRHLDFWKRIDREDVELEEFLTLSPYEAGDAQTRAILDRELSTFEQDVAEAIERLENEFAFTGVTEMFDESVLLLARRLQWRNLFYKRHNVGEYGKDSYNSDVMFEIENLNRRDQAVYNHMADKLRAEVSEQPYVFTKALSEYKFLIHDLSVGNKNSLNPEITDGPTLSGFLSMYLDAP